MTNRTFALLIALAPLACDAGSGNTNVARKAMDVELKAISADGDAGPAVDGGLAAPDGDGDVLAVASASVHIRDIELYLPEGIGCGDLDDDALGGFDCEDEDGDDGDDSDEAKLVLEGPFDVDLVSGEIVGDEVALPTGTYRRVDVRVDDDDDDVTFAAAGTMDLDGRTSRFRSGWTSTRTSGSKATSPSAKATRSAHSSLASTYSSGWPASHSTSACDVRVRRTPRSWSARTTPARARAATSRTRSATTSRRAVPCSPSERQNRKPTETPAVLRPAVKATVPSLAFHAL